MRDKVYRVVRRVCAVDWERTETICIVDNEELANEIKNYVEEHEREYHIEDRGYDYYVTEHRFIHGMEEFIEDEDDFLNDY